MLHIILFPRTKQAEQHPWSPPTVLSLSGRSSLSPPSSATPSPSYSGSSRMIVPLSASPPIPAGRPSPYASAPPPPPLPTRPSASSAISSSKGGLSLPKASLSSSPLSRVAILSSSRFSLRELGSFAALPSAQILNGVAALILFLFTLSLRFVQKSSSFLFLHFYYYCRRVASILFPNSCLQVLSCRAEVHAELIQQVLLFTVHNNSAGMGAVSLFLRPFLLFSIIRIPFLASLDTFIRDLISSLASLSCCLPSEGVDILRLITGCLKYFRHNNQEVLIDMLVC